MRLVRNQMSPADFQALKKKNRKRPPQPAPPAPETPGVANHDPLAIGEDESRDDLTMETEDGTGAADSQGRALNAEQTTALTRASSLDVNQLPAPLYLLVERSVELQPQRLGSLNHLGLLESDEQQRQGLILFSNARQARRQCRRNQRIVKVADPQLLQKTAPHLLAQGISHLVIEDILYALPGSEATAKT